MRVIVFFLFATLLVSPIVVFAQTSPLVPCVGGDACETCHAVRLAQNIINFLVYISGALAVLLFSFAGVLMVTAAGNTGQIEKGKGMFWNVLIGIVIVLAGWLIIDTVMKQLFEGSALQKNTAGFGPWNEIMCTGGVQSGTIPQTPSGTQQQGGQNNQGGNTSAGCPTCQAMSTEHVSCKAGANCNMVPDFNARLYKVAQTEGVPKLEVTEGYPPTRTHQAVCHSNGTCADVVYADRIFTPERIQSTIAAGQAAGLRYVYEPGPGQSCPSGLSSSQCLPHSVTRSTGSHFSVYMN